MEITDELLAAYAEGKVSPSERDAVRQYLMENPDQLETVMIIMDKDYELDLQDEELVNDSSSTNSEWALSDDLSSAAFAPRIIPNKKTTNSSTIVSKKNFDERLDELLDELDL